MAQKTGNEETEFKVPETLSLCVNNCGVTGNPGTNNMCQKCFNASTATSTSSNNTTTGGGPSSPRGTSTAIAATATGKVVVSGGGILKFSAEKLPRSSPSRSPKKDPAPESRLDREKAEASAAARREVNRCSGCRRKVGLTGFRCRCGELFCSEHRYSDRHDCSYDYKTVGREAIARENPVVKAAKIVRVWKKIDVVVSSLAWDFLQIAVKPVLTVILFQNGLIKGLRKTFSHVNLNKSSDVQSIL